MAALRVMSEMAAILGYPEDTKKYKNILQRGKKSYERKLWNGTWTSGVTIVKREDYFERFSIRINNPAKIKISLFCRSLL